MVNYVTVMENVPVTNASAILRSGSGRGASATTSPRIANLQVHGI